METFRIFLILWTNPQKLELHNKPAEVKISKFFDKISHKLLLDWMATLPDVNTEN